MTRFQYKFVRLSLKRGWWTATPAEDYQHIIEEHARQGWRLVQIFAPATSGYGSASYFEVILERPSGNEEQARELSESGRTSPC